jgi:hypothetical protein
MKKLFLCVVFLALAGAGYSQNAQDMDALLETRILNYGQAAWFTFSAAGVLADTVSMEEALNEARQRGWVPDSAASPDPVEYGKAAFLLMKAFDLKGGLFYRLFPGPRYAYRELVYRQIIQGASDASAKPSGEDFLNILGRILEIRESQAEEQDGGSGE